MAETLDFRCTQSCYPEEKSVLEYLLLRSENTIENHQKQENVTMKSPPPIYSIILFVILKEERKIYPGKKRKKVFWNWSLWAKLKSHCTFETVWGDFFDWKKMLTWFNMLWSDWSYFRKRNFSVCCFLHQGNLRTSGPIKTSEDGTETRQHCHYLKYWIVVFMPSLRSGCEEASNGAFSGSPGNTAGSQQVFCPDSLLQMPLQLFKQLLKTVAYVEQSLAQFTKEEL